jgi:hypothetical protein
VLTDRPQGDNEGVRIAATRAGQRNGDGEDGYEDDTHDDEARTSRIEEAPEERARTIRPPATSTKVSPARAKVLRQRRRRRRILIGVTAFLAVVNLLVGSGFLYV